MKTSGVFTLHRHAIPLTGANDAVRLVFFGDVHRDSPNHAETKWKEFLEYAKGLKNARFIGMGDYLDANSTSERISLNGIRHSLHETQRDSHEKEAYGKAKLFAKEIEFMQGRLIGLINGNHYFEHTNGTNTDQELCRLLKCKYLGVSSFVKLQFGLNGRWQTLDMWLHHGVGGSRLPGGSINRVEHMREHADAEIYAMGHDHRRGVWPANPRLSLEGDSKAPSGLRLRERQSWLIRSGSFLASYEDGVSNYNVDAARGPSSLGHVELEIRWRRETTRELEQGKRVKKQRVGLDVRGIA